MKSLLSLLLRQRLHSPCLPFRKVARRPLSPLIHRLCSRCLHHLRTRTPCRAKRRTSLKARRRQRFQEPCSPSPLPRFRQHSPQRLPPLSAVLSHPIPIPIPIPLFPTSLRRLLLLQADLFHPIQLFLTFLHKIRSPRQYRHRCQVPRALLIPRFSLSGRPRRRRPTPFQMSCLPHKGIAQTLLLKVSFRSRNPLTPRHPQAIAPTQPLVPSQLAALLMQ